jgi:hypothetical protein
MSILHNKRRQVRSAFVASREPSALKLALQTVPYHDSETDHHETANACVLQSVPQAPNRYPYLGPEERRRMRHTLPKR